MRKTRVTEISTAIGFCLIGIIAVALWNGDFLFNERLGIFDWTKESYYYAYLRSCLIEYGTLPWVFLKVPTELALYPALLQSLSAWANPEVLTVSPFLGVLAWVPYPVFIKIYVFGHLCIAVCGIYALSVSLKLNAIHAGLLVLLCVFNPWLIQHLAIGYTPSINACLIPAIAALLLKSPLTLSRLALASALNALMLYQGGLHVFNWFNGFALVLVLARTLQTRSAQSFMKIGMFWGASACLGAPKLFATMTAYGGWERVPQHSYDSFGDLWGIFTDTTTNPYLLPQAYDIYGVNLYDGSMAMGVSYLLLFAIAVGLYAWRGYRGSATTSAGNSDISGILLVTIAASILLGWNGVWERLALLFPLLSVEYYPWRFLVVAVMLGNVFIAIELFHASQRDRRFLALVGLCAILVGPVLYERNRLFSKVAAYSEALHQDFSAPAFLRENLTARKTSLTETETQWLDLEISANQVKIEPTQNPSHIELPWLSRSHLDAFSVVNGIPVESRSDSIAHLQPVDPSLPVILKARTYRAREIAIAGLSLWVGLLWICYRQTSMNRGKT